MLKRILSYLVPVNVFQTKSILSKNIEITWNKGELVLVSDNTNYSYGTLERVLRAGLKTIGYEKIASMQNILVLGVAGGSVIKLLVNEIQYKGKIKDGKLGDLAPTILTLMGITIPKEMSGTVLIDA